MSIITYGKRNIGQLLLSLCIVLVLFKVVTLYKSYDLSGPEQSEEKLHVNQDFKARRNLKNQEFDIFVENVQIDQDDSRILAYLLGEHLTPPPTSDLEYNLNCGGMTYCSEQLDQREQTKIGYYKTVDLLRKTINTLLSNKTNGFFIECGANDGEFLSNSLYFEKELNWTGLLIEADPLPYADLKKKNRKAYISNTCLSTEPNPTKLKLQRGEYQGLSKIDGVSKTKTGQIFESECFPLYSYLAAIGIKVVDYLSLDIEGVELKVLRNFPFDKVLIKILSVEVASNKLSVDNLKTFLESRNFTLYKSFRGPYIGDELFINKAVFDAIK